MSDNWVVQNLQKSLSTWNDKLAEVWKLLTQSPEDFKGELDETSVDFSDKVQVEGNLRFIIWI